MARVLDGLMRALAALAVLAYIVLGASAPAFATGVWLTDGLTLTHVHLDTGARERSIVLPGAAHIVGAGGGGVWAIVDGSLAYVSPADDPVVRVDIASLGYGSPALLAADPYAPRLWVVTTTGILLQVHAGGQVQRARTLDEPGIALAVGLDGTASVAGRESVWHYTEALAVRASVHTSGPTAVGLLVDSLRDRIHLIGATSMRIAAVNALLGEVTVHFTQPARSATLDPHTGRAWVLHPSELAAYDAQGRRVLQVALDGIDAAGAHSVIYDAGSDALVLTSARGAHQVSRDGRLRAAVSVAGVSGPAAVLPFEPTMRLSLVQPPPESTTTAREPAFVLQLASVCGGQSCELPWNYLDSAQLIASLNGRAGTEQLQRGSSAREWLFIPAAPLPLGANMFAARAVDRFGRPSNTVEALVTVIEPAQPIGTAQARKAPAVSLTAPANNATFYAGSDITLTAAATDSDGSVMQVAFYRGGTTLIGTATAPPYSIVWANVPAGMYKLTAKATDNQNSFTTSSIINISVNPRPNVAPTVAITSPAPGARLNGPDITVVATATDADGTVQKIDFHDGSMWVATVTGNGTATLNAQSSYANLGAGTHVLKATATDNGGAAASSTVTITVNAAPFVVITSPANCSIVDGPADVLLAADALDPDGSVVRVDFYLGATLLGSATRPPYAVTWRPPGLGAYAVTAVATDNLGARRASTPVSFTMALPNVAPVVSLTSPADGVTVGIGAAIPLQASASDADGSIVKVDFHAGATLLGSATSAPYTVTWTPAAAGSYTLTATATDNRGASVVSSPVHASAVTNKAPTVSLTAPANGTKYIPPATVNLVANATDSDGAVTRVEFYAGTALVGTATAAPYATTWRVSAGGTYSLTAKATDNRGAITTSSPVSITVATPPTATLTFPAENTAFGWDWWFDVESAASAPVNPLRKMDLLVAAGGGSATLNGSCSFTDNVTGAFSAHYCTYRQRSFAPGYYVLTLQATDSTGAYALSDPLHVTVNTKPVITLTQPVGRLFAPGASINLAATVTQNIGTPVKVEFYAGSTLVATRTSAPWDAVWNSAPAGDYAITAKVTDNGGGTATSAPVNISVSNNIAPTVSLTSPANGATFVSMASAPYTATIPLAATATDADGSIARVDFYDGTRLLGTATTAPFTATWTSATAGAHSITAHAVDNQGAVAISAPITIAVDRPPTITIDAPANNTVLPRGAGIMVTVNASDPDGTVVRIELLRDGAVIAATDVPPGVNAYTFNVAYTVTSSPVLLTARATDNAGVVATSPPIALIPQRDISVSLAVAGNVLIAPGDVRLSAIPVVEGAYVAKVEFFANGALIGTTSTAPYGMYWSSIAQGQYSVVARVTDSGGLSADSPAVTVRVLAAPTVAPAAGLDGSAVSDDVINITGTVQAPPNSAVTVNGRLAQTDPNGTFHANAVPLAAGANPIVVQVFSSGGATSTQTISVTSSGAAPFAITASPTSGIDPLTVDFTVTNRAGVPFDSVEFDLDGNGSAEATVPASSFVNGTLTGVSATYHAGNWNTVIRVKDAQGVVVYSRTVRISVETPLAHEAGVRAVYTGMLDRLRAGNVAGALTAVTSTVYDKYNAIFATLGSDLPSIVDELGEITDVTFNDDTAEYSIVRSTAAGARRFFVYLIRGSDGIWRIDGM